MDVPIASVEINGVAPCTFVEATLWPPFASVVGVLTEHELPVRILPENV
jgi:hypothetical protein